MWQRRPGTRPPRLAALGGGALTLMIIAGSTATVATAAMAAPTRPADTGRDPAASSAVAGAYTQVTVDGQRVGLGLEGVEHALVAYAAMHRVTGDPHQREVFEALLDHLLAARPSYMGTNLGVQVLADPFLRAHPALLANVRSYAGMLTEKYAADPGQLLHRGDIRTLTGNASFLVAYAEFLDDGQPGSQPPAGLASGPPGADAELRRVDAVATALLDRLVDLQFTVADATERFDNPRLTGGFPHLVDAADGNMGSWDVRTWSPAMLSIEQYAAVRALAEGFGRYHQAGYGRAAAAAARSLLSTREIDPDLLYAGSPPGFPLDGATFEFAEEGGEMPYLLTYGWSPNAVGDLGTALKALLENRITVPRSRDWAREYWGGSPSAAVLDPRRFREGLAAKLAFTHRFVEATQLPVPGTFPWIDLPRASFPGTGDDDLRRGGWYDGSGRGAMSAVYSRIALNGYVASGGADQALLTRAARWWDGMIVWE